MKSLTMTQIPQPKAGSQYRCTDADFDGTVTITSISGRYVYYDGDAEGFSTLDEFQQCYRPA